MGMMRKLRRVIIVGTAIYAVTCASVLYQRISMIEQFGPNVAQIGSANVAIVLASGLTRNGQASLESRLRMIRGVQLLRAGAVKQLIVTGGPSFDRPDLIIAEVMADIAFEQGIPRNKVIIEGSARTTLENLRFSLPLAREHGVRGDGSGLIIVTDALQADSTGRRNTFDHILFEQLVECFRGRSPSERFAWPRIQGMGNGVQLFIAMLT